MVEWNAPMGLFPRFRSGDPVALFIGQDAMQSFREWDFSPVVELFIPPFLLLMRIGILA